VTRVNKYGLSRDIDAAVKRLVRQRAGFGCVICGSAIYTYEHVDPMFAEATVHDPNCITLLCGGCHGRATEGLLSTASVQRAMASPICKETGFSLGPFDIDADPPTIQVGPVTARNVPVVIEAMGDEILRVEPPEEIKGPFHNSARLMVRVDQGFVVRSPSGAEFTTSGATIADSQVAIGRTILIAERNATTALVDQPAKP
jgi:hypothetical protein